MTGISNNYNFKRVDYQKPQNEKEEKPVVEEKKAEVKQPKESTKSVDLGQQASAVYGQAMVQSHKPEAPEDKTPAKPVGDSEGDAGMKPKRIYYIYAKVNGAYQKVGYYDDRYLDNKKPIDVYYVDGHYQDSEGNIYEINHWVPFN